jgi:hypothetical protein
MFSAAALGFSGLLELLCNPHQLAPRFWADATHDVRGRRGRETSSMPVLK